MIGHPMANCLLILYKMKRMNLLVKQTLIGEMLEAAAANTTISGCIIAWKTALGLDEYPRPSNL